MKIARSVLWSCAGYEPAVASCCPTMGNKFSGTGLVILLNCLVLMGAAYGYTFYFLPRLPGLGIVLPIVALLITVLLNRRLCQFLQSRNRWYWLLACLLPFLLLGPVSAAGFGYVLFSRELRLSGLLAVPGADPLQAYLAGQQAALFLIVILAVLLTLMFALPYILIYQFRRSAYHQILHHYHAQKRPVARFR